MKVKKWIFRIVALLIVVGLAVGAYAYLKTSKPPDVSYRTIAVERTDIVSKVTAAGTIQARVTVQVGSQVSGRVQELFADYNTKVTKGMVIAKLDPRIFEATISQSRARYKSAKANVEKSKIQLQDVERKLARVKAQRDEGLVSQQDLESAETAVTVAQTDVLAAEASLEQSRAQLHQDDVNLSLTTIVSPIDGVVISRSVDVGQTVAASLQAPVLFTIAEDLTKMQVEASVPESDVGRLQSGMNATFTVDAFPSKRFNGTIAQIRNAAQTLQNVVTYTAVIEADNASLDLRPGMTATVNILADERKDALAVSNAALRYRPPEGQSRRGRGASSASAGPWGSARPPSNAGPGDRSGSPDRKTVWVLNGSTPEPCRIQIGITDGTRTEVVLPPDGKPNCIQEGSELIVETVGGSEGDGSQQQGQQQRSGGPRLRF